METAQKSPWLIPLQALAMLIGRTILFGRVQFMFCTSSTTTAAKSQGGSDQSEKNGEVSSYLDLVHELQKIIRDLDDQFVSSRQSKIISGHGHRSPA